MMRDPEILGFILAAVVGGLLYFIPTFIAVYRGHKNMTPVFVVNLVTGWTLAGWIASLIWSLTSNTDRDVVAVKEVQQAAMKICPYCAEEIRNDAIFCKHCKNSLEPT